MNTNELTELLMMIDDMNTLTRVAITVGDTTVEVERTVGSPTAPVAAPTPEPARTPGPTQPELPVPSFGVANAEDGFGPLPAHPLQSNLATEGQRKYANDLANKLGTGDMMNIVHGLAHALEVPSHDILHPSEWAERLSRDQADAYLDVLEKQWGKQKRSGF